MRDLMSMINNQLSYVCSYGMIMTWVHKILMYKYIV